MKNRNKQKGPQGENHVFGIYDENDYVVMPDMKRPKVFAKIAEHHPESRILYMSSYTDNVIALQGILQVGVPFIQKPFTVKALLQKVSSVLDSKPA